MELVGMTDRGGAALTVLLTNMILTGRSGTEILVRNLARGLLSLGHRPIVYAHRLGPIADELRALSVPVVDDILSIRQPIDVIHGHHLSATATAVARFPDVPALFVCHDFVAAHDSPPHLPSIRRYIAVDATVAERLLTEGVDPSAMTTVLNRIDTDRFVPGPPLPDRPRRALAFAKNIGHLEAIRAACQARGISLDIVGAAAGRVVDTPERLIQDYDLVFASAMTAMEAMACGRGVIVCDGRGLAGWVTIERFEAWRTRNFGLRTLQGGMTDHAVGIEIDRYAPAEAASAMEQIRAEGGLRRQVSEYVAIYREIAAEWRSAPRDAGVFHRALALHLQNQFPGAEGGQPWLRERAQLLAEREAMAAGCERCEYGVRYALEAPQSAGVIQTLRGFSFREPGGIWTDGPHALLGLRAPDADGFDLHLTFVPLLTSAHPRQRVTIDVNGLPSADWEFLHDGEGAAAVERSIAVPANRISSDGRVWIHVSLHDPARPSMIMESLDDRLLGIFLTAVSLTPRTPPQEP